jgi:curved DNA-binding protein CbpA
MSASPAGKFQDHYALLGIDPHAVSETMHRAYATLAHKYHPDNPLTGNAEMFDGLNLAYEVLSDPVRRREFDELHGIGQEAGGPKFNGVEFFNALGREPALRSAILCLLYDRRRTRPSGPGVSMRSIESMVEATAVELSSALWYLKQRGLAASDDKSSLQITTDGMDFLTSQKPLLEDVMAFLKPAAIAISRTHSPQAQPETSPAPKHDAESMLDTLNGALANT